MSIFPPPIKLFQLLINLWEEDTKGYATSRWMQYKIPKSPVLQYGWMDDLIGFPTKLEGLKQHSEIRFSYGFKPVVRY
jgi:hypothetical protein